MPEPDYDSYSLQELQEVYNRIKRDRYPDRFKKVEAILNCPEKVAKLKLAAENAPDDSGFGAKGSDERKGWGWFYLIIGIVLLCTGTLVSKTGSFEIHSWPVRIFIFAVFAGVGFMLIGLKLPWRK